jgi:tRNA pseudouridine38-40 synthase
VQAFKLILAYDGTDFHGWQEQPGRRTVQGVVKQALSSVLGIEAVEITLAGAGRTDAGVHARGQAASFSAATSLPARALAPLLNRTLPPDVRARAAEPVDSTFHARHSARARRYAYRLLSVDDPLFARFAWWPRRRFDPDSLERGTRALRGEADFAAFRASGSGTGGTRCRVMRTGWSAEGTMLRFDIVADRFLYHMVRNIVGTALAVSSHADPGAAMAAVLASGDRGRGGVTAPPQGLCLEQVFYEETA